MLAANCCNMICVVLIRRLLCHDCVELKNEAMNINQRMFEDHAKIKKQVDDHCKKMSEDNRKLQKKVDDHNTKLKKQIDDLSQTVAKDNKKIQKQVDDLNEKINKMCEMQTEVMVKVTKMMTEVKLLKQIIPLGQPLVRKSIVIAGGRNQYEISSAEIFSWSQKKWTLINSMSTCRCRASAVIYKDEVVISGGEDHVTCTDTIETSSCDEFVEWKISPVKLPEVCKGHAAVMYKDSLLLCGGFELDDEDIEYLEYASDKIYEISMLPPYSTKVLTTMPGPRINHSMELFKDKLFIFGGNDDYICVFDTVMMFDLVTKEWKMMTPLPFAVDQMATVLWKNNVILVGGIPTKDAVVMYNLTTGESEYLPSMKHGRHGCTAVVTGDVLVVMGGIDGDKNYLKSVEVFDFQEQVWEELPDMNESRAYACAVVKPSYEPQHS